MFSSDDHYPHGGQHGRAGDAHAFVMGRKRRRSKKAASSDEDKGGHGDGVRDGNSGRDIDRVIDGDGEDDGDRYRNHDRTNDRNNDTTSDRNNDTTNDRTSDRNNDRNHDNDEDEDLFKLEDSEALRQYGLPLQFGGTRRSKDNESLGTFDCTEYDEHDYDNGYEHEEEDWAPQGKAPTRKKKRRLQKPHISTHAVFSDEMTVREIIAFHPRGLNYAAVAVAGDEDPTEGCPQKLHLKFDDDGQPILEHEGPSTANPADDAASIPAEEPPSTKDWAKKYRRQKYDLFHRFDQGVQLDEAGWFSVTPEAIALHTAQGLLGRIGCEVVWDAFAGVGGNAIQFALAGMHVVATELDETRIAMAQHNAGIYQVEQYIDFILADALRMDRIWRRPRHGTSPPLGAVFLSPPWGGPEYLRIETFDVATMLPLDVQEMVRVAHQLAPHVIYYVPKTTDVTRLAALLPSPTAHLKMERHTLDGRFKVLIVHCH